MARTSFISWRLAPSTARPTGMPPASVNRLRLTPLLPRSVGLGPVFPPAQRGFGQGPVHAQPTPVQTLQIVIAFQPGPPQLQEHPGGGPFLKAQVRGGAGANARGIQGLPLATGAKHVEDAVGAGPVRDPGAASAQGMGIHPLGKEWGQRLPQFVGYLEGAGGGVGRRGRAGAGRSRRLGFFRFLHSPSLVAPLPPSPFTTHAGFTHF